MITNTLSSYLDVLDTQEYFNGSILVEFKDEVLLCEGYGTANHAFDIKNDEDTKYRIGSITKGFIAMAILQLEERGLIHLDDPLERYVPGFKKGNLIRIHDVLIHSSGIKNFSSDSDYWTLNMRLPTTLKATLNKVKDLSLDFEPGSSFGYSNTEYAILASIIERVTCQSYTQFIEKNILNPLGMKDSGFDDGRRIINKLANGTTVWKDLIQPEFIDMTNAKGAYDMYATIKDLNLWCKALRSEQLVRFSTLEKMFTNYNGLCGYGWFLIPTTINNREVKRYYHFGDVNGYVNYLCCYPEEELTIIILSNFNLTPVEQMAQRIASMVLGGDTRLPQVKKTIRVESEDLTKYLGKYGVDGTNQCYDLTNENNHLYIEMTKMYGAIYKIELLPIAYDALSVEFRTRFIDERFIIESLNENHFILTHVDTTGTKTKAIKHGEV